MVARVFALSTYNAPALLVSPASALLLARVVASATRACTPFGISDAPVAMLVISPDAYSSSALPLSETLPVNIPDAADWITSAAWLAAVP